MFYWKCGGVEMKLPNELKMSSMDSSAHNAFFQPAAVHCLLLLAQASLLTPF